MWLQEFVWLEKDHEGSLANRNKGVPTPEQAAELVPEPMFCVETSVVALYWSLLVYDYKEVGLWQPFVLTKLCQQRISFDVAHV